MNFIHGDPSKVITSRIFDTFPVQDTRFIVNFDFTDITFIFHHGFTPALQEIAGQLDCAFIGFLVRMRVIEIQP